MSADYDLIAIADAGDLTIIPTTSSSPIAFQVSSQILCSASVVWRAMLGPTSRFQEAQDLRNTAAASPTINLEEGPEILRLVFLALHHRTNELPETLDFGALVKVAEACQKYQLAATLWFLGRTWARDHVSLALQPGYCQDWILVASVFGFEEVFTAVSREIVCKGRLLGDGSFSGPLNSHLSQGISADILLRRNDALVELQEHLRALERSCFNSPEEYACKFVERDLAIALGPGAAQERKTCYMMQAGNFYTLLRNLSFTLDGENSWDMLSLFDILHIVNEYQPLNLQHHLSIWNLCSFVPKLRKDFEDSIKGVRGLELKDYPSTRNFKKTTTIPAFSSS